MTHSMILQFAVRGTGGYLRDLFYPWLMYEYRVDTAGLAPVADHGYNMTIWLHNTRDDGAQISGRVGAALSLCGGAGKDAAESGIIDYDLTDPDCVQVAHATVMYGHRVELHVAHMGDLVMRLNSPEIIAQNDRGLPLR